MLFRPLKPHLYIVKLGFIGYLLYLLFLAKDKMLILVRTTSDIGAVLMSASNLCVDQKKKELELMFMKHYAPNRCLYIKVAKLRTGVGSARCHTYKIAVSKYQGRCEQRSEVFVKTFFFFFFWGGGVRSGGGGRGWGVTGWM